MGIIMTTSEGYSEAWVRRRCDLGPTRGPVKRELKWPSRCSLDMSQVPARDLSLTPTPKTDHKGESVRPGVSRTNFPWGLERVLGGLPGRGDVCTKGKSVLLSDQSCHLQPELPFRTRTEDFLQEVRSGWLHAPREDAPRTSQGSLPTPSVTWQMHFIHSFD